MIRRKKKDSLTPLQAEAAAWRYIVGWVSEAERKDSQFYEMDDENAWEHYLVNFNNSQHIKEMNKAFKKVAKIIYSSMKKSLEKQYYETKKI